MLASGYAVIGIGGTTTDQNEFEIYQSDTVITGNVAIGPFTDWTHGMDATINGTLYNNGNVNPTVTGTITGGINNSTPTAPIVADARAASIFAAGLTPTQTFATLSNGQTITGVSGANVIRVTGAVTISGGSTTFRLNGPSDAEFILQLTTSDQDALTLSGVTMNLIGGLTADNVLWNLNGLGGEVKINSGANVAGIFLAPDRSITSDHGIVLGALIGGGGPDDSPKVDGTVSIHSGSQITLPPPGDSVVPLPAPIAAGFLLFGGVGARKLLRRRAAQPGT